MVELTDCPNCGGPIINGGGIDIRCAACGMTYLELVDYFDDDVELAEEFVGEEAEAIELGYLDNDGVEGFESDW